jgi:hypothetical protein
MSEVRASVSRMLEKYRDMIRRFVIGDISATALRTQWVISSHRDSADGYGGWMARRRSSI